MVYIFGESVQKKIFNNSLFLKKSLAIITENLSKQLLKLPSIYKEELDNYFIALFATANSFKSIQK